MQWVVGHPLGKKTTPNSQGGGVLRAHTLKVEAACVGYGWSFTSLFSLRGVLVRFVQNLRPELHVSFMSEITLQCLSTQHGTLQMTQHNKGQIWEVNK